MGALGAEQIVVKGQFTTLQAVQLRVTHRNDGGVSNKQHCGNISEHVTSPSTMLISA